MEIGLMMHMGGRLVMFYNRTVFFHISATSVKDNIHSSLASSTICSASCRAINWCYS